jgi:hypothetical protein
VFTIERVGNPEIMTTLDIDIGFHNYEHVRPLMDGTVGIDGVAPEFHTAFVVSDIFERMIRGEEFGVSELGWTFYLRTLDQDDPPFIGLPIFLARQFRHSAIFVNTSAGIDTPRDLVGKTIGEFAIYGHDAGVAAKGMLADDYGVTPDRSRWLIGGFDYPIAPFDFVAQPHPDNVDVSRIPDGAALGPMLDAGEIDALISADIPDCVLSGSPNVARLFPEYRATEREYHRRTGIFPSMHIVVIRRDLAEANPDLIGSVYRAFTEAKDTVLQQYRQERILNHIDRPIPWISELYDQDREFFGDDWWPYGVAANRTTIDAVLRWNHEQGLTRRLMTCADVFAPELLDT